MNEDVLQTLLDQYLTGSLTESGKAQLVQIIDHPDNREKLELLMQESFIADRFLNAEDKTIRINIQNWLSNQITTNEETIRQTTNTKTTFPKLSSTKKSSYIRYAAAAILILAIGSGIYYWRSNKSEVISSKLEVTKNDIMPGSNRASLTVGNKTIELSSNKEGIIDNGNQLTYSDGSAITGTTYNLELTTYNSLTTPRGGQYQAVLPDGSKVWLNAASSIKFPSKFSDTERKVEITGEVYFEIAKDAKRPFKVSGTGQEIEVLGTAFNVKLYEEEAAKTSLVEGLVKVNSSILKPGKAYINGRIVTTDVEQDVAWKNGLFNFEGATLKDVMYQLERWYDIDVVYENQIPDISFVGKMSRNISLNDLLDILQRMKIHFRLEQGRKLIVTQ